MKNFVGSTSLARWIAFGCVLLTPEICRGDLTDVWWTELDAPHMTSHVENWTSMADFTGSLTTPLYFHSRARTTAGALPFTDMPVATGQAEVAWEARYRLDGTFHGSLPVDVAVSLDASLFTGAIGLAVSHAKVGAEVWVQGVRVFEKTQEAWSAVVDLKREDVLGSYVQHMNMNRGDELKIEGKLTAEAFSLEAWYGKAAAAADAGLFEPGLVVDAYVVPEPSSFLMAGVLLVCLARRLRRCALGRRVIGDPSPRT